MSILLKKQFAVIGAGNIGRILLEQLLNANVPPAHLIVCDFDTERASAAAAQ